MPSSTWGQWETIGAVSSLEFLKGHDGSYVGHSCHGGFSSILPKDMSTFQPLYL